MVKIIKIKNQSIRLTILDLQSKCVLILVTFLLFNSSVKAQIEKTDNLNRVIKSKDSLLFNIGFNTCDLNQFKNLLSEKFEFYHDQSGYTSSKDVFIRDFDKNICHISYKPQRKLVEGSMQVYPLKKNGVLYGAIEMGRHRFFAIEKGKSEYFTGIANFIHVWQLEEGNWKLVKALSFDHQDKETIEDQEKFNFDNDKEINEWLQKNNIPILGIGIISEGKLQKVKVYGELKKDITAPYNTIFNVASLTKPVTSIVTLKLVTMGKWNLDEPLCKYWIDPDVQNDPNSKKLTTRHVLSQQTGFPNWRWLNESKKLTFQFVPGSKYQYSGEGYEYLRKALENKFHKTLEQLADTLLFTPLEMRDTRFIWDKNVDESRFAIGYDTKGSMYPINKNKTANAADDLLTTIEDYSRFMVYVMNGDGLSDTIFNEMISHQVKLKDNKYFGLGWEIYDLGNGEYSLSHGGADEGVQTQVFLLPKSKQGLIIFTNVDDGFKVYEKLLNDYLGDKGRKIVSIEMKK